MMRILKQFGFDKLADLYLNMRAPDTFTHSSMYLLYTCIRREIKMKKEKV